MTECKAKGLLSFNMEIKNKEGMLREKNKHFKIKPRDEAKFFFILAKFGTEANILESANMLILSQEASEKYRSLKTKLLVSTNSQFAKKISVEVIWQKLSFFQDKRADFKIENLEFGFEFYFI